MHSIYFLRSLFGSCTKTVPSSSKSACCRALFRCCQLPLLPAEKSGPCSAVNCGFRIDEPHKKRYTIFRRCSCAARRRGVAQLVARLLWEQEAASSSLATPTTRKATMNRLLMRFCRGFICCLLLEIQLECALFVPYNSKNAFSGHLAGRGFCVVNRTAHLAGRRLEITPALITMPLFADFPAGSAHERHRHSTAMDVLILR